MWILYVLGFFLAFLVIAQLISRLPGERYVGLKKAIPTKELTPPEGEPKVENYVEQLTGISFPYFDTLLTIVEETPQSFTAKWKLDPKMEDYVEKTYGVTYAGSDAGMLRIHHLHAKKHEDVTVDLDRKEITLTLNAPGQTINCEIGIKTPADGFIPLAQSNNITFPK